MMKPKKSKDKLKGGEGRHFEGSRTVSEDMDDFDDDDDEEED